jgi:hypothetical protein
MGWEFHELIKDMKLTSDSLVTMNWKSFLAPTVWTQKVEWRLLTSIATPHSHPYAAGSSASAQSQAGMEGPRINNFGDSFAWAYSSFLPWGLQSIHNAISLKLWTCFGLFKAHYFENLETPASERLADLTGNYSHQKRSGSLNVWWPIWPRPSLPCSECLWNCICWLHMSSEEQAWCCAVHSCSAQWQENSQWNCLE